MRSLNLSAPWPQRAKKIATVTIVGVALVVACGVFLVHRFWPFTEESVRSRLAQSTSAQIRFGNFHTRFFPPGCVAEDVVIRRNSGGLFITVSRMIIRSTLFGLFRQHLSTLQAEDMHVELSHSDLVGANYSGQQITIDHFIADGSLLEIAQGAGRQPLRFTFHKFRLQNLGGSGKTKFSAIFDNPMPAGLLHTSGQFGPWNANSSATPVSGQYSLQNADLGVFEGLGGKITTSGSFNGTFKQMEVEGTTLTPEFEVTSTRHKLPLQTRFEASVNAITGETNLHDVKAKLGHDELDAFGSIAAQSDGKRAAVIQLTCTRGRIEDTFYPFISGRSPITGDVGFRIRVVIPAGQESFVKKIKLESEFQILNAALTNSQTESRMNQIAQGPHQKELFRDSQWQGRVNVTDGVANVSRLVVQEGDASAEFHGSYNLLNQRLNIHGKLATQASLSKTTSGIKAVFAKAIEPLLKKHRKEKIIPVKITGTYQHPSFGLDMQSRM